MTDTKPMVRDQARPRDRFLQAETSISLRHLNQIDVARRWRISTRTLERWRWERRGPAYLKVGNHVVYRIEDIEAYEAQRRTGSSA